MMKFQSTLNEEDDLLTFEISDEALETAGGIEVVGNLYTRSLHWPVCLSSLISPTDKTQTIGGTRVK